MIENGSKLFVNDDTEQLDKLKNTPANKDNNKIFPLFLIKKPPSFSSKINVNYSKHHRRICNFLEIEKKI